MAGSARKAAIEAASAGRSNSPQQAQDGDFYTRAQPGLVVTRQCVENQEN